MDNLSPNQEEYSGQLLTERNEDSKENKTCEDQVDPESESFEDASDSAMNYSDSIKNYCDADDHVDGDVFEDAQEDFSTEELEERRRKSQEIKEEGNRVFKEGNFRLAVDLYSEGLVCCPTSCHEERSVLLSNRAAARFHLIPSPDQGLTSLTQDSKVESPTRVLSRKEVQDEVISDCTQAIGLNPSYLKPLKKRAEVYRDYDDLDTKLDECLADYKRILELEPSNARQLHQVIRDLELRIQSRNERLKDEMMSKLKDLGNLVLKPFGLSTNNFEMTPNDSGGYSLNFKSTKWSFEWLLSTKLAIMKQATFHRKCGVYPKIWEN